MKNNWPKHLYALDVSRGVASLGVVLAHWSFFSHNHISPILNFNEEEQPLYKVFKIFYDKGGMGVEYFFLLSGFVFFWLYKDAVQNKIVSIRTFWVHRFSRLYPLHFATLLLVAILQMMYSIREGEYYRFVYNDLYHFILNAAFINKWGLEVGLSFNAPVWSVSIEILLYLVFVTVAFSGRGNLRFCLVISVLSFIVFHFIHHAIFKGLTLFFLGGVVYYLTCMVSAQYTYLKKPIYSITIMSWICVFINYYGFSLAEPILNLGILGKAFLIGFPFYILFPFTVSSLALVEIDFGPFLKRLSWVGDITYSSYLLHFPLQLVFVIALSFGFINQSFYLDIRYLLLYFVTLILLSYWVYNSYELPMQRKIREKLLKI